MSNTQIDLSIKDLADRTGLTPRMLNIYRANAERRLGRKLGNKIGKTVFFRPEEVKEILNERESGNAGNTGTSQNFSEAANFSQANNAAEGDILTGMDAVVASGDQNAIAVGQALGTRWNGLLWTAALQTMQTGMVQMQQQFGELHASVTVGLGAADLPQLTGNTMNTPALPERSEEG